MHVGLWGGGSWIFFSPCAGASVFVGLLFFVGVFFVFFGGGVGEAPPLNGQYKK